VSFSGPVVIPGDKFNSGQERVNPVFSLTGWSSSTHFLSFLGVWHSTELQEKLSTSWVIYPELHEMIVPSRER